MYTPKKKEPYYLVHYKEGKVQTFKSYESLIAQWKKIRHLYDKNLIGLSHKEPFDIWEYWRVRRALADQKSVRLRGILYTPEHLSITHRIVPYILKDSFGDVVEPKKVDQEYRKREKKPTYTWNSWKKRTGWKSHWRFPQTAQERSLAYALNDEDVLIKCRGLSRTRHLPTVYDDIPRDKYKGWKHCTKRKKQWARKIKANDVVRHEDFFNSLTVEFEYEEAVQSKRPIL